LQQAKNERCVFPANITVAFAGFPVVLPATPIKVYPAQKAQVLRRFLPLHKSTIKIITDL
jgi:hypothetical protein